MDDERTIDDLIAERIHQEVYYALDKRFATMDDQQVLVVYGPAVPGPQGPMGIRGFDCDTDRLDDLERRIAALEERT